MSKCWKNGADQLAQGRVATRLQCAKKMQCLWSAMKWSIHWRSYTNGQEAWNDTQQHSALGKYELESQMKKITLHIAIRMATV